MQKIKIRQAKLNDVPFLVSCAQAMAGETEGKKLDPAIVEKGIMGIITHSSYGFYVVAEAENSLVGTAMITYEWSDWRAALFWWLQSVYILPEWRGRKVFTKILHDIEKRAAERGQVAGIRLYVEKENHRAISVYHHSGFQELDYRLYEKEIIC